MRALVWLLRAFVFFALFAFALNNQQDTVVHWFFGFEWHTRLVMVVLAAFALGCAIGVLAMVPAWWRHRRVAQRLDAAGGDAAAASARAMPAAEPALPSQFGAEAAYPPPREGVR
jgi:lipopolysaccharide assembly protein A